MVVLEHESAFVRVNFTEPSYTFYVWMELEGLGPETEFRTPDLSSNNTPEEIAELVAGAVPNASEYNLAVDVRKFDNSELIAWINMLNEWMANYYKSGGSESEASAAWAAYSSSADGGSSFQFPPAGEASGTVQISFRNVSVVPSIIEVIAISDESMDGDGKSKISYDYRGSELRFQLSPLNLTKFEYVPPPPYVNLTWDENIPDCPDLYWNGSSIWNGSDIWSICSECEDAFAACDSSISCSIGVRGFLEGALSPSRFNAYEMSTEMDNYNRRPWGAMTYS
ncbi:hypothetical protein PHYSODRAFT_316331 [Phytophthora sojae]|uniref:Uncharacterized protein n=1 Tax=Phytophthora sojae (strain P6497) TaxID=1094619 RepID=G4ZPU2_PHYSP|nr:hypothetical protein PHYSODRAFT_316331 [Phytophthora sojae]EGZ16347.1 hypothetical protein PHYSODRAFT_316331 [Phytophthora sojae]|eukprot:XP_009530096.1 hypothetical protein PHYSODRAFT_316331 [Phytophthora sojae]